MPLNSIPPTVTCDALRQKIDAAVDKLWTDVGLHGGIVPGNGNDLADLIRAGVVGLKCFLCDSGVAEFPSVTLEQLATAIDGAAGLDPWILVHAESPEVLSAAKAAIEGQAASTYDD